MPGCAVAHCLSYSNRTKGTGIAYHGFPKDPRLQKIWISKCRRRDKFNLAYARICSRHFTKEDYIRDLQSELLGLPLKKILKKGAMPSVNFTLESNDVKSDKTDESNSEKNYATTESNAFKSSTATQSNGAKSGAPTVINIRVTSTTTLKENDMNHVTPTEITNGVPECKNQPDDHQSTIAVTSPKPSRADRFAARSIRKRALETIKNLPPRQIKFDQTTQTDNFTGPVIKKIKRLTGLLKTLDNENRKANDCCAKLRGKNKELRDLLTKARQELCQKTKQASSLMKKLEKKEMMENRRYGILDLTKQWKDGTFKT